MGSSCGQSGDNHQEMLGKLHPLPLLLFATIAGIICGYHIALPYWTLYAILGSAIAAFLAALIAKQTAATLICTLPIVFALSLFNVSEQLYRLPPTSHIVNFANKTNKDKLPIIGSIAKVPDFSQNRTSIVVQAHYLLDNNGAISKHGNPRPVTGNILISVSGRVDLAYNDLVKINSRLRKPHNFQNFGGFDYERYLRLDGIFVRGNINNPTDLIVLRSAENKSWKQRLAAFRQEIKEHIALNSVSPQREIIQALSIGISKEITPEIREEFSTTGIAHLLAISGFHIGIIAALFYFLAFNLFRLSPSLLLRYNGVKMASLATVIPIVFFALIAGTSPSVTRATIMVLTFIIALFLKRHSNIYNVIALAALIILTFSPAALFSISFQLSFGAVLAIVFISPPLGERFFPYRRKEERTGWRLRIAKIKRGALLTLAATISATIGVSPLLALHFNKISLVSIPANIFIIPIMGFLGIPLCAAIPFTILFSSTLAGFFIEAANWVISVSIAINRFFAMLPYASLYLATPKLWEIATYYLLIIIVVLGIGRKISRKATTMGVALCLSFFIANFSLNAYLRSTEKSLRLDVFDVASGNAVLLRIPPNKTMLVDGGGIYGSSFDIGKMVVAPALWREGITKIDYMVLSHPHPDHLDGLVFIAKAFRIGEVWKNGDDAPTESYREFLDTLKRQRIPLKVIGTAGHEQKMGKGSAYILPRKGQGEGNAKETKKRTNIDIVNEKALVVKIVFGNSSVLLPSDISCWEEAKLIEQDKGILKSQILLVPHHGSRFSSSEAFVEAVAPKIAIITCGYLNSFGHPSPEVLARYARYGVRVLRSDEDGQVSIKTDGHKIEVRSFTNPRWSEI